MADSDIIVSLHLVIPFVSMVTMIPFTIVNLLCTIQWNQSRGAWDQCYKTFFCNLQIFVIS
jgi:hypothetical protein